jgi:CRP/FNR family cyclic AMP-dependent transcriptional regulator
MSLPALKVLRRVPLFAELAEADLEALAALARERRYPKGSVIVFSGELGDALYVIARGRVKVVLLDEDGREVILAILGVGEHFGELSLIDGQPRSAHVIALDDTRLVVLRREDFRRRVEESPSLAWALLNELSRRLRRADQKIGALVLLDVHGRIARLLLEAAAESRTGSVIDKRLTHQTIAQLIGASRETVSRAMRDLQERGLISVERRQVTVTDRAGLERVAHVQA